MTSRYSIFAIRRALLGPLYQECESSKGVTIEQLQQQLDKLRATGVCAQSCTIDDITQACNLKTKLHSTQELKERLKCFNADRSQTVNDFNCLSNLYGQDVSDASLVKNITNDLQTLAIEDKYGIDDEEEDDEVFYRRYSAGLIDEQGNSLTGKAIVDTSCPVCKQGSIDSLTKPTIVAHSKPDRPDISDPTRIIPGFAHYICKDCLEHSLPINGPYCPLCRALILEDKLDVKYVLLAKYNKKVEALRRELGSDTPIPSLIDFITKLGDDEMILRKKYITYLLNLAHNHGSKSFDFTMLQDLDRDSRAGRQPTDDELDAVYQQVLSEISQGTIYSYVDFVKAWDLWNPQHATLPSPSETEEYLERFVPFSKWLAQFIADCYPGKDCKLGRIKYILESNVTLARPNLKPLKYYSGIQRRIIAPSLFWWSEAIKANNVNLLKMFQYYSFKRTISLAEYKTLATALDSAISDEMMKYLLLTSPQVLYLLRGYKSSNLFQSALSSLFKLSNSEKLQVLTTLKNTSEPATNQMLRWIAGSIYNQYPALQPELQALFNVSDIPFTYDMFAYFPTSIRGVTEMINKIVQLVNRNEIGAQEVAQFNTFLSQRLPRILSEQSNRTSVNKYLHNLVTYLYRFNRIIPTLLPDQKQALVLSDADTMSKLIDMIDYPNVSITTLAILSLILFTEENRKKLIDGIIANQDQIQTEKEHTTVSSLYEVLIKALELVASYYPDDTNVFNVYVSFLNGLRATKFTEAVSSVSMLSMPELPFVTNLQNKRVSGISEQVQEVIVVREAMLPILQFLINNYMLIDNIVDLFLALNAWDKPGTLNLPNLSLAPNFTKIGHLLLSVSLQGVPIIQKTYQVIKQHVAAHGSKAYDILQPSFIAELDRQIADIGDATDTALELYQRVLMLSFQLRVDNLINYILRATQYQIAHSSKVLKAGIDNGYAYLLPKLIRDSVVAKQLEPSLQIKFITKQIQNLSDYEDASDQDIITAINALFFSTDGLRVPLEAILTEAKASNLSLYPLLQRVYFSQADEDQAQTFTSTISAPGKRKRDGREDKDKRRKK